MEKPIPLAPATAEDIITDSASTEFKGTLIPFFWNGKGKFCST